MFIIEQLTVHTTEDKLKPVSLSQVNTFLLTLKLVPCMTTTPGQHCYAHFFLVLFAIPVATFGGVNGWSEDLMEAAAGGHVYRADPIGVQWD